MFLGLCHLSGQNYEVEILKIRKGSGIEHMRSSNPKKDKHVYNNIT